MTELSTGYLDFEQLDAEVVNIVDDLGAFGVDTAFVTFGGGCDRERLVQHRDIPVPVSELLQYIEKSESDGVYQFGDSDLHIRCAGVEFLICHECDVHCVGEENALLRAVRRRWRSDYKFSHERIHGATWHRLAGRAKDSREA